MTENDIEKLKIIYPPLIEEINRYRDWPIRILTFTSAFYFGLIGLFLLYKITIPWWAKIVLSLMVILLYIFTLSYLFKCHKNYLKARNIQARSQKKLELDKWTVDNTKEVFPPEWFSVRPETWRTGFWGWGFYALYATILFILSFITILIPNLHSISK